MSPRSPEQNEEIRQQTRQQIIDAAFELFAKNGYANTSIAAVAKKAGVSKGLIYHYFDSKQAILEGIFDQLVQLGDDILTFPENITPADKMRLVFDRTFDFIKSQPGLGRLMINLALQSDTIQTIKPKIEEVNKSQMALYVEILSELGYKNPDLEAYKLGAMMDGILMGYITMGDEYPLEEMKIQIMEEYAPS